MGLCPENDFRCNECTGYRRHIDQGTPQIWVGMFELQTGEVTNVGCEVGCIPCKQIDLSATYNALRSGGFRWARAHALIEPADELKANRLANGMVGDLRSINVANLVSRTRRVPGEIHYLRGVCYQNTFEGEAFGKGDVGADACDCDILPDTGVNLAEGEITCDGGEGLGEPVAGAFPDAFFFNRSDLIDMVNQYCRLVVDHDSRSMRIHTSSIFLYPPKILRTKGCMNNLVPPCTAKRRDVDPCYESGSEFLNDAHQAFNFVPIDMVDLRLTKGNDAAKYFPHVNDTILSFKNAVLRHIKTLPGVVTGLAFGQLDLVGSDGDNNAALWRRRYQPRFVTDCTALPIIPFEFGSCYLESSKNSIEGLAEVVIEPYVSEAQIEMWLDAQHVNNTPIGVQLRNDRERIYPHVRFRVTVEVSYRAHFKSPGARPVIRKDWLPEDHPDFGEETFLRIVNAGDEEYPTPGVFCQFPAIVAPEGSVGGTFDNPTANQPDRIVCTDALGNRFAIPNRVEWFGYIGMHSGMVRDINDGSLGIGFDSTDPTHQHNNECCRLLDRLHGLEVGGWPTHFETRDSVGESPVTLYGGSVRLNFREGNYGSICA